MRLLIADDDPSTAEILTPLLGASESTIFTAYSAQETMRILQTELPDVIVLDVMLPDMSGINLCRTIRRFCDAPILILSALDSPKMIIAALQAGADDYLVKPCSASVIAAHIAKLARRAGVNLSKETNFGYCPQIYHNRT